MSTVLSTLILLCNITILNVNDDQYYKGYSSVMVVEVSWSSGDIIPTPPNPNPTPPKPPEPDPNPGPKPPPPIPRINDLSPRFDDNYKMIIPPTILK